MRRYLDYLRIAWSVSWGLVAMLLCVLWVRSYWYWEGIELQKQKLGMVAKVYSFDGLLGFDKSYPLSDWTFGHVSIFSEPNRLQDGYHFFSWLTGSFFGVRFPHYFGLFLVGALSAIVWLPLPFKRFSLRTLLIAATLIAGILGLAVWSLR
jgi:hypothetical protein